MKRSGMEREETRRCVVGYEPTRRFRRRRRCSSRRARRSPRPRTRAREPPPPSARRARKGWRNSRGGTGGAEIDRTGRDARGGMDVRADGGVRRDRERRRRGPRVGATAALRGSRRLLAALRDVGALRRTSRIFYVKSSRKPGRRRVSRARSLVRRGGVDRPTFTSGRRR